MKRSFKSVLAAMLLVGSVGLIGGCGSAETIGYVDVQKIMQESQKGQEVAQQANQKRQELTQKVDAAQGDEAKAKANQEAQQEWAIFASTTQKSLHDYIEQNTGAVAKEKGVSIVLDKQAVTSGGEDLTDAVLDKMGRAPKADNTQNDKQQPASTESK